MAYGYRGRYSRRGGSRGVYVGSGSTGNAAVKRTYTAAAKKYSKKAAPTSQKTLANKMAIMTLSKQVNQLSRTRLGDFQQCLTKYGFQPTQVPAVELPVCFCINDFNNTYVHNVGAPIYRGNGSSYTKQGNFDQLVNFPVASDLVDYNYKSENNQASRIIYAPISSTMEIQCAKTITPADEAIWIRIDIVKQKKVVKNLIRNLQLPDSIVGLGKMALNNAAVRNKYNKEFLTVLETKYIKLVNNDISSKMIRRSVKFHCKFNPKKPIRTDSEADGSTNTENDFYTNVDPLEQVWCIINFSQNDLVGLDVNIQKTNRWYDQHGTD